MKQEIVTHEIKLHRSIIVLLWVFALAFILNTLPIGSIAPQAFAELSPNPTITVKLELSEGFSRNVDLDD